MRDDIKIVLHILHTESHSLNVVHLCKGYSVSRDLLHHEVNVLLFIIHILKADIEVTSGLKISLEVAISLSNLGMNFRASLSLLLPHLELNLLCVHTADIIMQLKLPIQANTSGRKSIDILFDLETELLGILSTQSSGQSVADCCNDSEDSENSCAKITT